MGVWGQMGIDTAVGSIHIMRATFLSRIVNRTIGRECGRVLGPVDIMVSVLYTVLVGLDMLMNNTYQRE
jgi:hypothetical protein